MTAVCLEIGKQRVFASALDWPGWCRAGRGEQAALDALRSAAGRYAIVAREAGVPFVPSASGEFDVVERLPGSASTDFGVPGAVAALESDALSAADAEQMTALVSACWTLFDRVVASAPAQLRKGPRGGGRDRDKIVDHVLGAEVGYASRLGLRLNSPQFADTRALSAFRNTVASTLRSSAVHANPVEKGRWPPRYAARRIAWHVLDHAWEIEDRTNR